MGIFLISKKPDASVAAPKAVPSIYTFAPIRFYPLSLVTVPEIVTAFRSFVKPTIKKIRKMFLKILSKINYFNKVILPTCE